MRMEEAPEWMESWLQVPFYSLFCRGHANKYATIYCGECREEPVCETCWKNDSTNHQHHTPVLRVCIASHRAAVDVTDIAKVWDVSGIQIYIINHKKILHLKPKLDEGTRAVMRAENDHRPACQTCQRKITQSPNTPSSVAFCSIACKHYKRSAVAANMQMADDTSNFASLSSMAPPQNAVAKTINVAVPPVLNGDRKMPSLEKNVVVVLQKGSTSSSRSSRRCKRELVEKLEIMSCTSASMGEKSNNKSLRKKSRKGIPRRAPFQ